MPFVLIPWKLFTRMWIELVVCQFLAAFVFGLSKWNSIVIFFKLQTTKPIVLTVAHLIPNPNPSKLKNKEQGKRKYPEGWHSHFQIFLGTLTGCTLDGVVGNTGYCSNLATFLLIKLYVDPLSMSITTSHYPTLAMTRMVLEVYLLVKSFSDISSTVCELARDSTGSSSNHSSLSLVPFPSIKKSCETRHFWPIVNFLS